MGDKYRKGNTVTVIKYSFTSGCYFCDIPGTHKHEMKNGLVHELRLLGFTKLRADERGEYARNLHKWETYNQS